MTAKAPKSESGAIAVVVAVFALVMFVLAAIVVDLGFARETRREAQNTADASALAGAGELYSSSGALQGDRAIRAVKEYAQSNFGTTDGQWSGCATTLPAGWSSTVGAASSGTDCIAFFRAASGRYTKVQVLVPTKRTGSLFGGVIGYQGSDIDALAQASIAPESDFSCVVCVLANYEGQNGSLSVTSGGVAINGRISLREQGGITATGIGVAGGGLQPDGQADKGTLTPAGVVIPKFTDPLASMPLPGRANFSFPATGWPALATTAVDPPISGTCNPGVYTTIDDCRTLASGIYVVTRESKLAGQGDLNGSGVLLYMGCADRNDKWVLCSSGSADQQGTIEDAGQGVYRLTPMASGPYAGFTVIFDPVNDSTYRQVGNGASVLGGGIYGASATLDNRGTGAGTPENCEDSDPANDKGCPMDITGMVVVKNVEFSGQDSIKVTYSGSPASLSGPDILRLIK